MRSFSLFIVASALLVGCSAKKKDWERYEGSARTTTISQFVEWKGLVFPMLPKWSYRKLTYDSVRFYSDDSPEIQTVYWPVNEDIAPGADLRLWLAQDLKVDASKVEDRTLSYGKLPAFRVKTESDGAQIIQGIFRSGDTVFRYTYKYLPELDSTGALAHEQWYQHYWIETDPEEVKRRVPGVGVR